MKELRYTLATVNNKEFGGELHFCNLLYDVFIFYFFTSTYKVLRVLQGSLQSIRKNDLFGSPVYYANASGQISSFLDRAFYSGSAAFAYKPGAAVASCRRAGTTATLDQLNKYFTINCMPVVSSQYWNMVHGNTPEEVVQDKEGLQIMRTLGSNMAWLLHCIQAGKEQGIALPEREPKEKTNFIR